MSGEKNTEVAGCDASIMRNVWEIREREYGQRLQLERERLEISALPSINQDWANRLAAKGGGVKRVKRKTENQTDNDNVWKSKQSQVPPSLPYAGGSGPLGRPGGQSRAFSTPAPNYKDKKGQDKNVKRLQLLMFITQTQPSAIVWGKSWKYNKSSPSPAESDEARSNWGHCWMFATKQPYSEAGKPWLNGPNMVNPHSLHLWKKPYYRMVESQELDLSIPTEEWQMSWRKFDKNNKADASSINGENVQKSGIFTFLVETQHQNEALCSSEWSESWRSTKPAGQQNNFTVSNDLIKEREMSFKWEECWKFDNYYGCNKSNLPQPLKSHSPEWDNSWRIAMLVFNNYTNSDPSLMQDHSDTYNDRSQQRESQLHKVICVFHEQKYRDLYLELCKECKALSEWSKSWQMTKNNSKPCEEIEKILKISPPQMEASLESQKMEKNQNGHYSTLECVDPYNEQLKHNIYIYKREFTQSKLQHLKHLKNVSSGSEWKDSWKTLKHRMRMEGRRLRPDPLRPFRGSEKGGDMKPTTSEWKDSWKFTCQSLSQEPELWQHGWSNMPQIRADRARGHNHFAPGELPKNWPNEERSWEGSWMFSRRQCLSEPGQGTARMTSYHPDDAQRGCIRSVSDWQAAWMVSETQLHLDRPSLMEWRKAWRWSIFHTEHWTEEVSIKKWVDMLMEIQPQREKISLQGAKAKISFSFDNQMFRERYPEKQWNASWRAGSLLKHQPSPFGSSQVLGKTTSSTTQQQHTTANEHGSKWGRSFRLANPMPHMEQPWVESSPNPCYYTVMWSRQKKIQNNIIINFINNPAMSRLWGNSHRFLQNAQIKNKKSKEPVDPRVIITKKTQTRRHLYSNIEKEKQSERKWAGCHLLGKTQPRPQRGRASVNKLKMEDEANDKFFEEWAESWRFSVRPSSLKKQMPVKSLSGWVESWKFLLPPYQPMNSPKAR